MPACGPAISRTVTCRSTPITAPEVAAALDKLIGRGERRLERVEALLPPVAQDPGWKKVTAARWRKRGGRGYLQALPHPHAVALSGLVAIDEQKKTIDQNTRQ